MVHRSIPMVSDLASHGVVSSVLPLFKNIGWLFLASSAVVYFLFQKKMLNKHYSKIVSGLFFVPTFPITVLLRLGNYWTVLDDSVYLGCAPVGFLGHPKILYKQGVRGVINMCTEYAGPQSYYADLGIKQLRLPTVDHYEPTVDQMQEAVKFIESCRKNGEKVYIHCKAGHGRAASIAMCWLMSQNLGKSPQVATEKSDV